jgi:hypothetical protein
VGQGGYLILVREYIESYTGYIGWLEKRPKYCQKEIIVKLWGREGAETRTENK